MVRVVGGGRFLRWTEFQHRGGERRQGGTRNSSRQGGGSRARSNSRGYDSQDQDGFQTQQRRSRGGQVNYDRRSSRTQHSDHYGPITDDLIDRIANRLSQRDNRETR